MNRSEQEGTARFDVIRSTVIRGIEDVARARFNVIRFDVIRFTVIRGIEDVARARFNVIRFDVIKIYCNQTEDG